jgi:hypothetical protein
MKYRIAPISVLLAALIVFGFASATAQELDIELGTDFLEYELGATLQIVATNHSEYGIWLYHTPPITVWSVATGEIVYPGTALPDLNVIAAGAAESYSWDQLDGEFGEQVPAGDYRIELDWSTEAPDPIHSGTASCLITILESVPVRPSSLSAVRALY